MSGAALRSLPRDLAPEAGFTASGSGEATDCAPEVRAVGSASGEKSNGSSTALRL